MNDPNAAPPPPPPPPPEEPRPGRPGNDWERRGELGFVQGLVGASKALITSPGEAFSQTLKSGDLASPVLFAVIVSVVTAMIGQLWVMVLGTSMLSMFPAEMQESFGLFMVSSGAGFFVGLIIMPIVTVVWIFLWGAIVHVLLMLVGGLDNSEAGFEGTLRVVAYSSIGNVAKLVPVIGDLISLVWMIVLMVIGLNRIHGTSEGKAVAAVLLPVVLCCVCAAGVMMVGLGAVMSSLGG